MTHDRPINCSLVKFLKPSLVFADVEEGHGRLDVWNALQAETVVEAGNSRKVVRFGAEPAENEHGGLRLEHS